ncbi:SDR family oxidoreductase [Microbacterium sp. zg.B48]|uniref:SDR family NAD(P)-dependent oxidoreductase n=1 Tax=unclassified Microbacterium TaxID=2609290 RepID=UPI00214C05D3|nr:MULTISPECIES: SDR family NAD(P)-dependent oxidoreductase [unclassified Microbacterium]MCR2763057.1 SDR family oxidoreductase [Microbacterium sp. zg.B48]MCR2808628.1 SDR family oxidoreductase [Microbacterium sp. zg.B185]WIM18938.1 SDR family oxidoreductase [Microbacterium sp. zg-B185]
MSAIRLDGRSAIVTGAGRSLGRAYAIALADAGAAVVVNDVDAASAAETVGEITARGGRAVASIGAVGPAETAEQLVADAVQQFGRVDVLVANAGVLRDRVLWKMSDDDFDAVVSSHLRGTFTCGRAVATRLREQGEGGRLILVGSPAGQFGSFGQTNYSAVKAGIVAMARTWSLELARAGITANAVIPTALSPMTATIPAYTELYQRYLAGEPIPHAFRHDNALGTPEDVAPLIVWLASAASGDVTGQAIGIGGDKLTLYSHPVEQDAEYSDGGWSAETIDSAWHSRFAGQAPRSGPPVRDGGEK